MGSKTNTTGWWTYRSEQLRGGDGRAVTVQLDPTSQIKVTDLDRGNLQNKEIFLKCISQRFTRLF